MTSSEEFTITIEPDGRIIFDGRGMQLTSYRRILDLLEETVGPAIPVEVGEDPPTRHLGHETHSAAEDALRLGRKP